MKITLRITEKTIFKFFE